MRSEVEIAGKWFTREEIEQAYMELNKPVAGAHLKIRSNTYLVPADTVVEILRKGHQEQCNWGKTDSHRRLMLIDIDTGEWYCPLPEEVPSWSTN